jgi:hypothetical protein
VAKINYKNERNRTLDKNRKFFVEHFQTEKNPPIETLMFLIGIQELGSGQQKYSKDDKINLLHIAVCRLLEPFGFINLKIMMMTAGLFISN